MLNDFVGKVNLFCWEAQYKNLKTDLLLKRILYIPY